MITLYLFFACGALLGLIDTIIFITLAHRATVKILETLRLYPPGQLRSEFRDYVDGKGNRVNRRCYVMSENGRESFENGRVFAFMLFLLVPPYLLLAFIVYELFGRNIII